MKKILAIALAFVLMLGVTACGDGDGVAGKGEFLGLADGVEFTTDHEVTITFVRPKGNDAQEEWWSEIIPAFNTAYAGRIRVAAEDPLVRGDSSSYEQQIGLRVAEGLPDVLYMDGPYVSNWAHSGMIIPIDNYLTETYLSDFMDYVLDQGTFNERLYALSIVDSTIMVFYRKSVMNEFLATNPRYSDNTQIKLPTSVEEAWTFNQLAEIATKMTKKVGNNTRYGLSITGDKTEWMSYAFSPMWGGNILGEDGLTATGNLNSARGIAAGNYLRNLRESKAINPSAGATDFYADGTNEQVTRGGVLKASMFLTGTQNITEFEKYPNVLEDLDATYYPRNNDGSYSVPCGGWTLAMSKDCAAEKRVAAVEFIKYLTSVSSCQSFADKTASPPARKSLYDSMDAYKDGSTLQGGLYTRIKAQILKAATPRTKTVAYAEFSPQLSKALNEIITQNSDLDIAKKLTDTATTVDNKIRQASYK